MGHDVNSIRSVAVGDGQITMAFSGTAGGAPLVLIPGLSDGLAPLFEPHARKALRPPPAPLKSFEVLTVSHRHPLPAEADTRDLAADLATALEVRLERPAVVAAHSMGAMVAQHLAADRPDLVDRLVLSATLARADDDFRAVLRHWEDLLRQGRWRAFYRDAIVRSFTGGGRRRRLAWLRVAPVPRPEHLVPRHLALSRACATHDATARLAAIRAPTLVLAGSDDRVVSARRAVGLAEAVQAGRHRVLPGLGHAFPEQAGARFLDLVEDFLHDRPVSEDGT